jgi:hypothetical protein
MMAFYKAGLGWLTPGNHNHLRLTRIMLSLRALGLEHEARELYAYVTERATQRGGVTADTLRYWLAAIS